MQKRNEDLLLEQARFLTLTCDGKTDVSKRNVTNYLLCDNNGTSIMYDFTSGTPAKDAVSIARELIEVGRKVKDKTPAILSFISDSAGSYVKARDVLKASSVNPFKFVGPCLAHQSNLILKVRMRSRYIVRWR